MHLPRVFLSTGLSRKLFWGILLLTSVAFVAAGLSFQHIAMRYQEQAASKLVATASRAFERGVLERLFAAEQVARAVGIVTEDAATAPIGQQERMFRQIRIEHAGPSLANAVAGRLSRFTLSARADGGLDGVLRVPSADGETDIVALLADDYLWMHADTALLRICIRSDELAQRCLDGAALSSRPTVVRTLNFEPYLQGLPWEVTAQGTDEVERFGPLSVGLVSISFVALFTLMAAAGASVFLRRVTEALATLVSANRAAQEGRLAERIDTTRWKDELLELGASFNAMMQSLETSFSYQRALQRLDAAIVSRAPMTDLIALVHAYAAERGEALALRVSMDEADLTGVPSPAHEAVCGNCIPLIDLEGKRYGVRIAAPTVQSEQASQLRTELENLAQRLVIAAQSYSDRRRLVHQAATDTLTGLHNRFGFIDSLEHAVSSGDWPVLDVVYLDLNGFKEINDAFGHSAGDQLLVDVGERFAGSLSNAEAFAARLGGDEFAFALRREGAAAAMERLQGAFVEPFALGDMKLRMHGSFGVARYPEDADTVAELLRKADLAMYQAKNAGDALAHYTPELESDAAARLALVEDMRSALALGQLTLVFQPRLQRQQPAGLSAEVLLRWNHPSLGMVSPARFIPLAEEHGLIDGIGDWVLAQACQQFAYWRDAGYPIVQLSVNVSPKQLLADDFFARTAGLLEKWQLQDGAIELEVTEGALVNDVAKASEGMQRLRTAGCHIAIDDFGVGFSALGYLHRLPFDTLKIDKMFVDEVHTKPASKAIATAIVALAKSMGKNVVAEGVEHQQQVDVLDGLGVDEYQGFLFSRPLSREAFSDMLALHGIAG
ncbi:bifunctional diguanylate cyclase/phosphodiesterase [Pseudorhodoferax sp. Leaf265]|uniref:putative bifunctional diguanylate cyclase/phosphodiesterase n=1 Tax=Pseudorhodoferax sp. Leaf265 TaxID=1736315 RepID=UPI0006F8EC22|nr:EAL domain-containing protein [Pseudorhodoferax sp. Leaf265]KQP12075.1 hypothetical protein ASF45_32235 [Pseudorhodoferax sp. Leaf265]